jgi:isoquinoline 1-oxidoreductase subunit beta
MWPKPVHNTVIVVADSYWIAKRAADALEIEFNAGPAAGLDSKKILDDRNAALDANKAVVATKLGDVQQVLDGNRNEIIEARYHVPYLVHATMEPVVATAQCARGRD